MILVSDRHNIDPPREHICTGTLITAKDIAIAAHCLTDKAKRAVRIIIGSIDLTQGYPYNVYWWITYDQWALQQGIQSEYEVNDVANIRVFNDLYKCFFI
jgi:V8-like Glu-specific endopeptidase